MSKRPSTRSIFILATIIINTSRNVEQCQGSVDHNIGYTIVYITIALPIIVTINPVASDYAWLQTCCRVVASSANNTALLANDVAVIYLVQAANRCCVRIGALSNVLSACDDPTSNSGVARPRSTRSIVLRAATAAATIQYQPVYTCAAAKQSHTASKTTTSKQLQSLRFTACNGRERKKRNEALR